MALLHCAPGHRGQAEHVPELQGREKVYEHGFATHFKVIKKADGITGRRFIGADQNVTSHYPDHEKDGVACET